MSWGIGVSTQIVGFGIAQVGWRFSTESITHWVQPGFMCVAEDEIPDNISVDLTLRFESGYTIDFWEISRDGGDAETETSASIQVRSEGASFVYVFAHAKEAPPPPTYSVSARKSTNFGDGISTVSVSKSIAEEGESVQFSATLEPGYVFLLWATVDGAPREQDIVSTDSTFWYTVRGNTTLYAYAGRPTSGVNLLAVRDGEWHPASLVVVATKNGVKQWRNTNLACVDGSEWKS